MEQDIVTIASLIADAGEEERTLLEALCRNAAKYWEKRLRMEVIPDEYGDAFRCAAAYTAAADLVESRVGGEGVTSFSAGAVSVKTAATAERSGSAAALRQAAERLMAPYAEAADFAFKGVRG